MILKAKLIYAKMRPHITTHVGTRTVAKFENSLLNEGLYPSATSSLSSSSDVSTVEGGLFSSSRLLLFSMVVISFQEWMESKNLFFFQQLAPMGIFNCPELRLSLENGDGFDGMRADESGRR